MLKGQCDFQLGKDVLETCLRNGGLIWDCVFYAGGYHIGVSLGGQHAYQSAQEEKGCIACSLPVPLLDPLVVIQPALNMEIGDANDETV